jgi:hypothetical protein
MNSRYPTVLALFSVLLLSTAYQSAYSQSEIALSLDKQVYSVNESVVITGIVPAVSNIPLILQVWNPNSEACSFQQTNVSDDGSFAASPVLLSGRICGVTGSYTVKAFYGELEGTVTFEVQLPRGSEGTSRLKILLDILNRAKQNVDNKINDLEGKGITISDDVNAKYSYGVVELESAKQAVEINDAEGAKAHAKNAMGAFREVFAALAQLEEGESSEAGATEGSERAEEVSRLRQAIARAVEFRNKLENLASESNANIASGLADFDKVINDAAKFAENGEMDSAARSLADARQILSGIQKSLMQNAQKGREDKAREFVARTVERIDRMIADAKAIGLPTEVIDMLEAAKQKLLNAKDIEILNISKELQGVEERLLEQKGRNFERTLEHLKSEVRETKARAEHAGLNLDVFQRIESIIDEAEGKWRAGEVNSAVEMLEKSTVMLREISNILEKIRDELHNLNELAGLARELKGKYQDDEVQKAIDKALRLIEGARETLQSATSRKDFKIAEDMSQQAEYILERIQKSGEHDGSAEKGRDVERYAAELEEKANQLKRVAQEKGNEEALSAIRQALALIAKAKQSADNARSLLDDAAKILDRVAAMLREGSDAREGKDSITRKIKALENVAAELKSRAGDNENAVEEITAALNDLAKAKESVAKGELADAKEKVNDAKEHLRKAKEIIEQDREGSEDNERNSNEREKERGKNESG